MSHLPQFPSGKSAGRLGHAAGAVIAMAAVGVTLAFSSAAASAQGMSAPAMMKGGMMVGQDGMTLYTFDQDKDGKSMCNGGCAQNWPPLMADANAMPMGDWTIGTRDDGGKQWAYKGKPLYRWSKDTKPGDMTGDGVRNMWHVVK